MSLTRRELFGLLRRSPAGQSTDVADVPSVADADRVTADPPRAPEAPPPATTIAEPPSAAMPPSVEAAAPPAFSLDAFYAARSPDRVIPVFAVRSPEAIPTTRVGLGRTPQTAAPATEPANPPRDGGASRIASELVPRVLPHQCLATRSFCSVCVERCPVSGAIVVERGRPRVVAERCDGCGHCVAACPAPVLAFQLVRRASEDIP